MCLIPVCRVKACWTWQLSVCCTCCCLSGKFLNGFNPALDKTQLCPAGWTTFEPLVKVGASSLHNWSVGKLDKAAIAQLSSCCPLLMLPMVVPTLWRVQPYIMHYWDTSFTRDCGPTYLVRNQYTTDVILNKTLHYIK